MNLESSVYNGSAL